MKCFDEDRERNNGESPVNEWEYSDVKQWLNGSFIDSSFSINEKNAIAESSIEKHDYVMGTPVDSFFGMREYTPLKNDKVFFLDFEDVLNINYGYSSDSGWTGEFGPFTGVHNVKNR